MMAARKATVIVGKLIFKDERPVEATVSMGKLNPMKIIEYCNNFFPDQFNPGREFSGKLVNSLSKIPKIKAKTLDPMMGNKVPKNIAQRANPKAIAIPKLFVFIFLDSFQKSAGLDPLAGSSKLSEEARPVSAHLKFVFHIVW